ncbi:MAG TPA: cysteine desulfurase family protein [Rhizomicrobium sp.]
MIYLDHNATSPLRHEAREAMLRALETGGNPSSVHAAGRGARAMIEKARGQVAAYAGASVGELIFTSGGAESNALALRGAVASALEAEDRITRLFVIATAHESVRSVAASLGETVAGLVVTEIPVDANGRVDPKTFRLLLMNGKGRALVSLIAVNNETGVIEDVAALAKILRAEGGGRALLHVDAVCSAFVRFANWDADYLALSAHKLGGPQGTGALIARESTPLAPLFNGAQEKRRRAGTENLSGIAGFGAAAAAAHIDASKLRDAFEAKLLSVAPDAVIFASDAPRQGNTSCFAIPGVVAETALMALDLDGICISSGAACSSGKVSPSHVLAAMGVSESLARSALRVSFGWNSTGADVDGAIASLSKLIARVRARKAA